MEHLHDSMMSRKSSSAPAAVFVDVTEQTHKSAARLYDSGSVAGSVRFEWDVLEWFEEDEPIIGPPRSPYVRVDALRSHRHIRVELDGVVLAETHSPVLLFETGLPHRYYIDRTDVVFERLDTTSTQTVCPYKEITSQYWAISRTRRRGVSRSRLDDDYLLRQVAPIAGIIGVVQREARYLGRRHPLGSAFHPFQVATG